MRLSQKLNKPTTRKREEKKMRPDRGETRVASVQKVRSRDSCTEPQRRLAAEGKMPLVTLG